MATYKIKKGDNLTKIAKQYGTTVDALAKSNNIKDKNLIITGKTLIVPGAKASSGTPSAVQGRRSAPVKGIYQTKPTATTKPKTGAAGLASMAKGKVKNPNGTIGSAITSDTYKMNVGKSNLTKAQRDAIAAKQSSNDKVVTAIVQTAIPGLGVGKVIKGIRAIKAAKAAGATVKTVKSLPAAPVRAALGVGPKGAAAQLAKTTTRTSNAVPKSVSGVQAVARAKNNVDRLAAGVKKGNATKGELNKAQVMLRAEVQSALRKMGK